MSGPSSIVPDLLGASESILAVKERLSRAAKVDRPVLLLGERGTGKELAAARLHFLSRRWQGPYVALNCAALSPGLIDAELFGHEAGAFTGARGRRPGRFEAADGGTLFLDEISHLGAGAQARILRVVEYGSFQLVGGSGEMTVDVRVVAATNADLKKMCRTGAFLPDLWDRLSFEVVTLPPLRDRPGDVTYLAHFFGARMARELGQELMPVFTPEALRKLDTYFWPGNVRELKNVVERAVYRARGDSDEDGGGDGQDEKGSVSGQIMIGPELLEFDEELYPDGPRQEGDDAGRERDHLSEREFSGEGERSRDREFSREQEFRRDRTGAKPGQYPKPDDEEISLPLAPGEFDLIIRRRSLEIIERAMEEARRNQARAAELLGMTYHRFRSLRRKLG
ncbi:MAG: sigma 54-interacting transcriptional regulator [Deltaproteobacteria bacterium]|jgi:psp operon transcriptional activator|nr:sigma 54-interacting transcriptional regulator [Deltaproteobacteria bacterium]